MYQVKTLNEPNWQSKQADDCHLKIDACLLLNPEFILAANALVVLPVSYNRWLVSEQSEGWVDNSVLGYKLSHLGCYCVGCFKCYNNYLVKKSRTMTVNPDSKFTCSS